MVSGRAAALLLVLGIAGAATTVGCFENEEADGVTDDPIRDRPVQGAEAVLDSTVLLASGCSAVKVGPRHLLLAARCVTDHAELAAGATLEYEIASGNTAAHKPVSPADAGSDASEVVADEASAEEEAEDAGAPAPTLAPKFGPTIERVVVHAGFESKCADDRCAFGSLAAGEVRDVAVIILASDLGGDIPTIPVDLDSVREGDTLVAVGGGCRTIDAPPRRERITRTLAVPARAATHAGSAYASSPGLVSRLEQGYVVTPGRGWRSGDPGLCRTDIGAPLVRSGGTLAVAGVTAGFSYADAAEPLPVTIHHTRVDTASGVGPWLESLGVQTVFSCRSGGCMKVNVSADVPSIAQMDQARDTADLVDDEEADAGLIAEDGGDAGRKGMSGEQVELGKSSDKGYSSSDPTYADAGRPRKNQVISACATTSGPVRGGSPFAFAALGLALVSLARRRGGPRRG